MSSGYVLTFSDRSFAEFVDDSTGLNVFDVKYKHASGSKANRLRASWKLEGNAVVGKLLGDWLSTRATVSEPERSQKSAGGSPRA